DIQSNLFPYKGMMLEKQALELVLGQLGATSKSIFVLYDNSGNVDAARLWWILTTYGHSNTYLLNGGLQNTPKGLISQEITSNKPAKFLFPKTERLNLKANKADVLAALTDSNTVLLDCCTLDEFTGKVIKKNAFRSGHIPTAVHINYTQSIAYHQAYQFRSDQELALIFRAIPKNKKIIVYCQSGVRSAHTTFVLHQLLGFPNVANYDGSWIEWSHDKTLPIEVGL
ncbi:MAG: sulfurtransferase, partial [Aureispira sp.]|nr:sulfurtransferase [Aureispira sp.]